MGGGGAGIARRARRRGGPNARRLHGRGLEPVCDRLQPRVRSGPDRPRRLYALSASQRKSVSVALLYGRVGRLTARSGGFWPGQSPRRRPSSQARRPARSSRRRAMTMQRRSAGIVCTRSMFFMMPARRMKPKRPRIPARICTGEASAHEEWRRAAVRGAWHTALKSGNKGSPQ